MSQSASQTTTTAAVQVSARATLTHKPIRFHSNCGENIILEDDNTVATRKSNSGDALIFSERPLQPGEVFLIEIEETETCEARHLRIGLTQLFPKVIGPRNANLPEFSWTTWMKVRSKYMAAPKRFAMPKFAWPDLENMGGTWLHTLSLDSQGKMLRKTIDEKNIFISGRSPGGKELDYDRPILDATKQIRTPGGMLSKRYLRSQLPLPQADCGSRIGIIYVPTEKDESKGEMHLLVNGQDEGVFTRQVPLNGIPIHVVIELFGKVKRIRIVQP